MKPLRKIGNRQEKQMYANERTKQETVQMYGRLKVID